MLFLPEKLLERDRPPSGGSGGVKDKWRPVGRAMGVGGAGGRHEGESGGSGEVVVTVGGERRAAVSGRADASPSSPSHPPMVSDSPLSSGDLGAMVVLDFFEEKPCKSRMPLGVSDSFRMMTGRGVPSRSGASSLGSRGTLGLLANDKHLTGRPSVHFQMTPHCHFHV